MRKIFLGICLSLALSAQASGTDVLTFSTTTDYTNIKNVGVTLMDNQGMSEDMTDYDITVFGANTAQSAASRTPYGSVVLWNAIADASSYFSHNYLQLISATTGTDQPSDVAFPQYMVIASKDNHPFKFAGFSYYTEDNTEKVHVEGFRKGVSTGSVSLALPSGTEEDGYDHHPTYGASSFPVETFGTVDEIRISKEVSSTVELPGSTNVFNDFVIQKPHITIDENSDNTATIENLASEKCNVSITRTLKHGQWNTFCVPFDLSSSDISSTLGSNVNIQTLSSSTIKNGTINMVFTQATDIKAGVPYLIWVNGSSDIVNPTFPQVETIVTTTKPTVTDHVTFTGITSPYALTINDQNQLFLSSDGTQLLYATSGTKMKGLRAFFTISSYGAAKSFAFQFEESTTGIQETEAPRTPTAPDAFYSINGMKVGADHQGIIIKNGKKYVNR